MTTIMMGTAVAAEAGANAKPAAVRSPGSNDMTVVVNDILNRWQPAAAAAGLDAGVWREMFATQLFMMDAKSLRTLAEVRAQDGSASSYQSFLRAFKGVQAQKYGSDPAIKAQLKLNSATNDQVFVPVNPCRIVDTRNSGGPIGFGAERDFLFYVAASNGGAFSWTSQGGIPAGTALSNCPGTVVTSLGGTLGSVAPSAAVATVTVTNATAAGNYVVWGGAGVFPQSSVLNWTAGQTLANTTVIPGGGRSPAGVLDFTVRYNGPSGQADVIVDVVGYFVENHATQLDCQLSTIHGAGTADFPIGTVRSVSTPACGAGFARVGTNCHWDGATPGVYVVDVSSVFEQCTYENHLAATQSTFDIGAEALCCRLPGQ